MRSIGSLLQDDHRSPKSVLQISGNSILSSSSSNNCSSSTSRPSGNQSEQGALCLSSTLSFFSRYPASALARKSRHIKTPAELDRSNAWGRYHPLLWG